MSKGVRKIFFASVQIAQRIWKWQPHIKMQTAIETVFALIIPSSLYHHQSLDNQKRKDKNCCIRLLTYDEKKHSYCIDQ